MTIETLKNSQPKRRLEIELEALEFSSLCPLTGAPDFGRLLIRYVPGEALLELKSLRDYLTSFRDRKILQEEVVGAVLDEIVLSASPRFVEVEGLFNVRGGIETRVRAQIGENPLDA
ncbi:MAG TPA: preQ(1) synthase [Gaiellaceae bacterium]